MDVEGRVYDLQKVKSLLKNAVPKTLGNFCDCTSNQVSSPIPFLSLIQTLEADDLRQLPTSNSRN